MTGFGVRLADERDADAVGRLLHAFNREYDEPTPDPPTLAARIRELLAEGTTDVLLLDGPGGDPEGLVVLRFRSSIWSPAQECYVAELYVVPERRGGGRGQALMEAALERARARGADHVDLGTSEDDVAARRLYERLGFRCREGGPDGPLMFVYEREL
ncbi:GNAT family N-acetyltransferase [Patulibacter defluvii]|uniref:GNAT family N-acetyltransferase n=1 Tax=Patulibacter defluvii TaxID=3095358 RepID=UPI002A7475D2|nr:GNAT family N-acetyltransferase [Patulibacter sp. DM4]